MGWLDDIRHDLRHGHTHRHHHHRGRLERRIADLQRELAQARATEHTDAAHIEHQLAEITSLLDQLVIGIPATDVNFTQLEGAPMGTLNGVVVGSSGVFQASPLPPNGLLAKGTSYSFTTGDTSVALSASPDADPTKVVATVDIAEALPTFGITVAWTDSAGNAHTKSFDIPVLQPAVPATDVDLTQLS